MGLEQFSQIPKVPFFIFFRASSIDLRVFFSEVERPMRSCFSEKLEARSTISPPLGLLSLEKLSFCWMRF